MINKSTVKYIQSLRTKKFRDEHNAFIAEGPKVVTEFLEHDLFKCDALYSTSKGAELLNNSLLRMPEGLVLSEDYELDKITSLTTANEVLGVFKKRPDAEINDFSGKLTLILDDIQDPGNLGTIIRTADWFGIKNILCSAATADCYNPKVVQSTMASLGRVSISYCDIDLVLEQNDNIKTYAAVLEGDDVNSFRHTEEGFLIIGNESKGISAQLLKRVDHKISIMRKGKAESLNAGVATGIILFSLTNS